MTTPDNYDRLMLDMETEDAIIRLYPAYSGGAYITVDSTIRMRGSSLTIDNIDQLIDTLGHIRAHLIGQGERPAGGQQESDGE